MATRFEELVAGLESILPRPLTDEERDSVAVWDKCRELESFILNFPREWEILKETLQSYADEYTEDWDALKKVPPGRKDLDVLHGQVYAVAKVINSFISAVEYAPTAASLVPDIVKDGCARIQAMPKEAFKK